MMFKNNAFLFVVSVALASASPAIIWKNNEGETRSPIHLSNDISSGSLIANVLSSSTQNAPVEAVIFLIGRGAEGNEVLSALASDGALPNIAKRQSSAHSIYHHVSGVKSIASVVSDTSRAGHNPLLVNLGGVSKKLAEFTDTSDVTITGSRRSKSNVIVVDISASTDANLIDTEVLSAIQSELVNTVVLTAVRSIDEIRQERFMIERRRLEMMEKAGLGIKTAANRRRLEQVQADDGANQAQNDAVDLSGIYYVSLTPNILAGLLFFVLFSTITYIGVSCMGAIAGQDVYASKMPAIGREA